VGAGLAGGQVAGDAGGLAGSDVDVDFEPPDERAVQEAMAAAMAEEATAAAAGELAAAAAAAAVPGPAATLTLATVPALSLEAGAAMALLERLSEAEPAELAAAGVVLSEGVEYWALASRFALHVVAQQRFVPLLMQYPSGELRAAWKPWLADDAMATKVALLVGACPPEARCAVDGHEHDAWSLTDAFVTSAVDSVCRRALRQDGFETTIAGKDATKDAQVAWLAGLLGEGAEVQATLPMRQDLTRRVRGWVGTLEERGTSSTWRLLLRLAEPDVLGMAPDAAPLPDAPAWKLSFHLQAVDSPLVVLDAEDIWLLRSESATIMGRRIEGPQELLLQELGRASRMYRRLEESLTDNKPKGLVLSTKQAYEFLREVRPVMLEQGFGVDAPAWWDSPAARIGAKLKIEGEQEGAPGAAGAGLSSAGKAQLGLAQLVNYKWEISVGDTTLTMQEFEQLAAKRTPLVRVNGRWVEIRPEDVHAAIKFIRENPGGKISLTDAMRLAYASDPKDTGIQVVGLEAQGWLAGFLNSEVASIQMKLLEPPKLFKGTLRPYQARGVSWMMFQERLGFGICLADDMGLGKTVQLLAMLAYERQDDNADAADEAAHAAAQGLVRPTLLMVPMSVVGNWVHETRRFCPHLRVLVHHGVERSQGAAFLEKANASDLVITTYALAHRDRETLGMVEWGRIVLDEAQYIKNPASKQSQAVRALQAQRRVALTGTPVENRLSELWSIMDFLNPGYLGGSSGFRTRFALPIERYKDKQRGEQLRGLVRPFVLRRLKSDPTVVADLPAKLESREFGYLTAEQASLYEACVKRMLSEVDSAEGMQRRGLVLSALVRLKQICNHPSQVLKDWEASGPRVPDASRSGKCVRLLEMLDEVIGEGDQSLIFTQFRQMGHILETLIRRRFERDVLFIHGGTTQTQRTAMVERFQRADGTVPVLLLSLRAGGVGLNLTAATHVFHFDRWWNPAVENQATDRAYRIGQTRTVQVHKFVVRGTLEERIDQMIESKSELAENIIGAGEAWLSELSTDQLRDILTLRNDAIDDVE
jgi:SNF2 family DNA or RNA helicase